MAENRRFVSGYLRGGKFTTVSDPKLPPRRTPESMQGSAAQTTHSINNFVQNNFSVLNLKGSFPNEHKRWAASYRHVNKLTGADQHPSPGVVRYAMRYKPSRDRYGR